MLLDFNPNKINNKNTATWGLEIRPIVSATPDIQTPKLQFWRSL
jgi:hypothetical protein